MLELCILLNRLHNTLVHPFTCMLKGSKALQRMYCRQEHLYLMQMHTLAATGPGPAVQSKRQSVHWHELQTQHPQLRMCIVDGTVD